MIAYLFLASKKFISPNPRGFLPRPLLRAGNQIRISPEKISLGFAKSFSPENSFGKTESTELALEFRQFLLWRNPTSPATTIPKKKKSRQIKKECVVARRGRKRNSRSGGTRLPACSGADAVPWRNSSWSVQLHFTSPQAWSVPHSLPHFVLKIGSNLVQ